MGYHCNYGARWKRLMFNGWINLRMWETHLSEGIQIFRIVSDKWSLFCIKIDKCTPESETSIEHLSEGIRIFLIASDKWYLFWNTNLFWPFFRGFQINFVTVGQMMLYQLPPLVHALCIATPSYLQSIRQNAHYSTMGRCFSPSFSLYIA